MSDPNRLQYHAAAIATPFGGDDAGIDPHGANLPNEDRRADDFGPNLGHCEAQRGGGEKRKSDTKGGPMRRRRNSDGRKRKTRRHERQP